MAFTGAIRKIFGRPDETALCMNSSYFGFFAHAGFLQGLNEIGLEIDHVSGASAGAVVAGAYAAGVSTREMISLFLSPELRKAIVEWQALFRMAGVITNRRGFIGSLSGNKAKKLIKAKLGDKQIQDCVHPSLSISVANLTMCRTEIITEGPIADFIMASSAMPGMFQAQKINGNYLMDGGVADPVPFEHWLDNTRIRRIILHLVTSEDNRSKNDSSFSILGAIDRSYDIIKDEILRLKLRLAEKSGKKITIVHTRTPRLGPGKVHMGRYNIELGRKSALAINVK